MAKMTKPTDKGMTPKQAQTMMVQHQKDATLPSLLYVTRKLGEVEGMISMQTDPGEALINVQKDLKRVYDKLVERADIELLAESEGVGVSIGGDS